MSSRRISLPGADELFRSTGTPEPAEPEPASVRALAPAPTPTVEPPPDDEAAPWDDRAGGPAAPVAVRRRPRTGERRPTGRERHDEKITVYVSAEELIDLERARLTLRGDHGLAVDRGRIVREALAMVLADLDAKGDQSSLVRRLRGR